MFQFVALQQGSTIIEFTDGVSYALASYAPGVGYRNDNALGPLYADVTDTLTFHAIGFTAADAYAAAAAVNTLLDQAWRWANNEPVSAVRLRIQPQDGTLALPLEVVIQGRAGGSPPPLALPEQDDEFAGKYVIRDIPIQFVRNGELLYPTAETGTSTAAANPTVQSIALVTPTTVSSPTSLTCTFQNAGVASAGYMDSGIILTGSAAGRLQIYDTTGFTYGANIANFNDSANLARSTNVARYTPGVLSGTALSAATAGWDTSARLVAVYAAVRNNSATTAFTIQVRVNMAGGTNFYGPIVPVDNSTLSPRIMFLGIVRTRQQIDNIALLLTASVAAGTLDINYLVIQAIDDETGGALTVIDADTGGHAGGIPITVDNKILSEPVALITSLSGGITYTLSYSGSPILYTRGSFVVTILATDLTLWRVANGVTLLNTLWTASRLGAYLVPA